MKEGKVNPKYLDSTEKFVREFEGNYVREIRPSNTATVKEVWGGNKYEGLMFVGTLDVKKDVHAYYSDFRFNEGVYGGPVALIETGQFIQEYLESMID